MVPAICKRWRATSSARCLLGVMLSWSGSRLPGGPTGRCGSWGSLRAPPSMCRPLSNSLTSASHSGPDISVASGGVGGVRLTVPCTLWAITRCRTTLTPATISERGLVRAGGEPSMPCSSSTELSSAMSSVSTASTPSGSEAISNREAGSVSAAALLRAPAPSARRTMRMLCCSAPAPIAWSASSASNANCTCFCP